MRYRELTVGLLGFVHDKKGTLWSFLRYMKTSAYILTDLSLCLL